MAFEFLDHTADIGVRITAGSPPELLEEAVRAFYAILLDDRDPGGIEEHVERPVDLSTPDGESLVVELLSELIYRFDAEKLILPRLRVEEARLGPRGGRLRGKLRGERFDPRRHALATEVKAATYHGIRIEEESGLLRVDVIFDL
jgi:SHS2 domain-containing protein